MKISKFEIIFILLVILNSLIHSQKTDSTIVEKYGQLKVQGNKIVNQYGEPIVLRGMSLFWSQWMGQYYNSNCIKWLKDEWKCNVVRAAMGIEMGGYLQNPIVEKNKIKNVINACIEEGIYVIVDWHDHNAHNHQTEAIEFFKEIANEYKDIPNLIYEIYNEPEQISWPNIVKPYSDSVVSEIRKIDSDNIILVGSPTWSQDVDIAANNPVQFDNIAYSLHFYAATHKQYLRDKAKNALAKGVALFVSEFGTCEANGSGVLDYTEMSKWFDFMEKNKLSWCNWSIADKEETSAALTPGASGQGGWSETQITESGKLIRSKLIELNTITNVKLELIKPTNGLKINSIHNYPNPFNSSTIIRFSLNENSYLKFDLYNSLGEKLQNIIDDNYNKGEYSFSFDFSRYSSGNYFLSCQAENQRKTIKLQYMR
jgi:endoglucanase